MFRKFLFHAITYILLALVFILINTISTIEDLSETQVLHVNDEWGGVRIDPESLSNMIDALNQVDNTSADGFRELNSVFDDAHELEFREKESLIDRASEEVTSTLHDILVIETYLDVLVVSMVVSLCLYILLHLVNESWCAICNTKTGAPIIRVVLLHPYLLVILTYAALILFFKDN